MCVEPRKNSSHKGITICIYHIWQSCPASSIWIGIFNYRVALHDRQNQPYDWFLMGRQSQWGKPRLEFVSRHHLEGTLWKLDTANQTPIPSPFPSPPPHDPIDGTLLTPAGSNRGRLDSIRHLFYFFLFLFFNLVSGERSGLVIDVALSKPETGNHCRCHGSPKAIFLSPSSSLICV